MDKKDKIIESYYTPHLEWEFANYPITINNLKIEKTDWGFDQTTTISFERNDKNKLIGKISGNVKEPKKFKDDHFIGEGNIIKGQIIIGNDADGNVIEIHECIINTIQTNSWQFSSDGYFIDGILTMDSVKIQFLNQIISKEKTTRLDWFSCSEISAHFWGQTFRSLKLPLKKVRVGIDKYEDSIENIIGSSTSKDYVLVTIPELNFIIAKVPKEFTSNEHEGICFEFRENLDKINNDLLYGIRNFVSFLLGNELHYFGHSLIQNQKLTEILLENCKKYKKAYSMPPIKFNFKYDWGNIGWLLNNFLSKYLQLCKTLPIDDALLRYWIARNLPLGVNLPILSSAMEMIVDEFLKTSTNCKLEYLTKEDYITLIGSEADRIKEKLLLVEGANIMMNKILGAFRKGPNEKMNLFFLANGIKVGKVEKEAINLRNKMAHGARDYSSEKRVHSDLIYTRVYEVLFNRTILKLLDYKDYYIDYSLKGCPLKHIDAEGGKN